MCSSTEKVPGVAQLVGRLVWDQDAASSSLATRTIKIRRGFCLSLFLYPRGKETRASKYKAPVEPCSPGRVPAAPYNLLKANWQRVSPPELL